MKRAAFVICAAAAAAPRAARAQSVTIRAAVTPVYYDAEPILYAQKTGAFAKAGLDLQLGRLPTGAAITAAVAGGSLDVGKSTFSPVVAAFASGIPITVIAPCAIYDSRSPNGMLLVHKDSPIRVAADLRNKLVAVNNLGDPTKVGMLQWLVQHGQKSDAPVLVEIPMRAMAAELDRKGIDAILLTSPVLDEELATGKYRTLAIPNDAIARRWLFSAFFATKDWAANHKDAVKRFADTLTQSAAHVNRHHRELVPALAPLVGSTDDALARERYPEGGTALRATEMQPLIDLMRKFEIIHQDVDARDMIFDPNKV
jgi:ABC-type nitrate/sulfonate/bicarbonate transport system substrate-binding protein